MNKKFIKKGTQNLQQGNIAKAFFFLQKINKQPKT